MRSTKALIYAGHRVKVGDVFQATGESDARILSAIKKAERYTPPVVVPAMPPVVAPKQEVAPQHATKAIETASGDAGDSPTAATADPEAKPKRSTYRRRDLTAEE